ncbi:carbohydrate ABC transporter permease [Paenibacillus solisilvae]|uniref:Carbohydrate ABC transporter permease n=1 Tax=Paenibacillus solisilvae TaxID=2486751 RepID=A0ABW0VTT0_9BACL
MNKKLSKINLILLWAVLIVIAVLFIFPFIMMLSGSFSDTREIIPRKNFWIPEYLYYGNYKNFFGSSEALPWIINSFIYGVIPVVTGTFINTLVGYIFAKKRFRGSNLLFFLFLSMMMIPAQVSLVPNYIMYTNVFDFINSYSAILVPGLWSISNMFLMRQFASTLPDSIIEAAEIDGSGDFKTFFLIVFPMLKTPIAVMGLFAFLAYWNLYLPVLIYMNDQSLYNLTVGVGTMVQLDGNYGMQMLGAVVCMVPVFIFYVSCQKYIVEGINLSGLKG